MSLTTFAYGKEVQMSEFGIATAASDRLVLAVISHLNEGNTEDAVALFGDQFSFRVHGIQLEFNTKAPIDRISSESARILPGLPLAN